MSRPVVLGAVFKQAGTYVSSISPDANLDMGVGSGRWIIVGSVQLGGGSTIGAASASIGGVTLNAGTDTSLFDTTGSPGRLRWFTLASDSIPTGPQPLSVLLYGGLADCEIVVIWGNNATGVSAEGVIQSALHSGVDPRTISYTRASDSDSLAVLPFFVSTTGTYPTYDPVILANGGTTQQVWGKPISGTQHGLVWTKNGEVITTLTGTVSGSQYSPNSYSRAFSVTGVVDLTAPTITGPTGTVGAASIAVSISEASTSVGTWTANEAVTWSVSGTDASKISIVPSTGVCTLVGPLDFEFPTDVGVNNVLDFIVTATDSSNNSSAQTVALTVLNANEAPTFNGPSISIPSGVAGAAIAAQNFASLFSDQDSGDTATYSKGGSWPVGPTLSAGGVLGGVYPASGISSGLTVIRTDSGGLNVSSNAFVLDSTVAAVPVAFSGPVPAQSLTLTVAYSVALAGYFAGNVLPFTYSVVSGLLPTGVTLNSTTGALTGTPTVAGSFNAVIRATDNAANVANTANVSFTVAAAPTAPVILSDPLNQSAVAPAPATFSVIASGTLPLTYQWQRSPGGSGIYANVIDGTGADTRTYTTAATTLTGGTANNTDTYRCVVTNVAGTVTSAVATLTVTAPLDSTPPTLTGSLVASSVLTTSYTLSWPSASDNVAVFGYELSLDGGTTYFPVGLLLTYNITDRIPGSTDACQVRAYDQIGNRSAALSLAVTPTPTTLTTDPLENDSGSLHLGVLVNYSWFPGGRIGALAGITPIEGTATTHTTTGVLTVGGLLLGSGVLMTCIRNSSAATDDIHYQALSVV